MTPVHVTVAAGVDWVQVSLALLTCVAVIVAALAARSSAVAANAAVAAVEIERVRREEEVEDRLTHQARCVSVAMAFHAPDDRSAPRTVHLRISNDGDEPIRHVRYRVTLGSAVVGPSLISDQAMLGPHLGPHTAYDADLLLDCVGVDTGNADTEVRFVDVRGNAWIATSRNTLEQADNPLPQSWMGPST